MFRRGKGGQSGRSQGFTKHSCREKDEGYRCGGEAVGKRAVSQVEAGRGPELRGPERGGAEGSRSTLVEALGQSGL